MLKLELVSFILLITGFFLVFIANKETMGAGTVTLGALGYLIENAWEHNAAFTIIWFLLVIANIVLTVKAYYLFGFNKKID